VRLLGRSQDASNPSISTTRLESRIQTVPIPVRDIYRKELEMLVAVPSVAESSGRGCRKSILTNTPNASNIKTWRLKINPSLLYIFASSA
jgi:hypothetical protein